MYEDILDATTALVNFINQTNALKGVMTGLAVSGGIKAFLTIKTGIHDAYINLNQFQNALNMVKQTNISSADFDRLLLLTNNLSESQMRLIMSTDALSISQKEDLLVARGLSREKAKLKLQTYGVTQAQTGLTASTTSAKTAMQGFISVLKTNPLFVIATAISAVSMAVSTYKNHLEEVRQATEQSATVYKESSSSIDDYVSRYQDLQKALQDARGDEEQTASVKQQLLDLQNELNDAYGTEYGKLNLVTDAYKDQTEAIKALNKEEANKFLNENRKGISTATAKMEKEQDYVLSAPTLSVDTPDGKALQEIVDSYADEGMRLISDDATGAVQIVLKADAQTAYETLNNFETDLRNKAKELGNENLFDDILDFSTNALNNAKSIIDKYGEIYNQAQMANLVTDENASSVYEKALSAVEEYNNAVMASEDPFNDENVAKAKANVESVMAEAEGLGKYGTIFEDVFDQADRRLLDFNEKLKSDTSLQEWAEQLRGKEIVDLKSMVNDGQDDVFDKLVESAKEYGLEVEEVIDALVRLGYVQGEVANADTPEINASSLDNLNSQIDSIQSAYKGLLTAAEEYNQYGYVTADTFQTLLALDSQYVDCLIDENGQLIINGTTYQNLVKAKLADAEATAVKQAIEELGKITTEQQIQADTTAIGVMAQKGTALATLTGQYAALANVAVSAAQAQALADAYTDASSKNKEEADRVMSNLNAKLALIQNTAKNTSGSFGALTNHLNGFSDASGKAKNATDDLTDSIKQQREALEATKSELEEQKKQYDDLYSAIQWHLDKRIDGIESEIDGIQDLNSELEKQKDILGEIIKAVQNNIDTEINAIQDKIDALKNANTESEKQIALEQAKQDLLKASQKTSLVYTKDKGFIRTEDKKALSEAQQNLENAQNDVIIEGLEKEIDLLEEIKDKWGAVATAREDALNAESAKDYFGDEWRETTLNPSDEMLGSFTNNYVGIQDNIAFNEAKIDSLEKEKERIQELKDLWSDAKESYINSENEARLKAFFGSDYEYQLLYNSATWRRKFASEYSSICAEIASVEEQLKSLNEETTSSVESGANKIASSADKVREATNGIKFEIDHSALEEAKLKLERLDSQIAFGQQGLETARNAVANFIKEYEAADGCTTITEGLAQAVLELNGIYGNTGDSMAGMISGINSDIESFEVQSRTLSENLTEVDTQMQSIGNSEEQVEETVNTELSNVEITISNLLTKLGELQTKLGEISLSRTEVEAIADEELLDTSAVVDGVHTKVGEIQTAITILMESITPLHGALDALMQKLTTLDEVTLSNVIGAFGGASGGEGGESKESGNKSSSKGKKGSEGESGGGTGLLGAVKAVDEAIGSVDNEESLLGKLAQVDASTLENIIAQFGLNGENGDSEGANLLNAVNAVSQAIVGGGKDDENSLLASIQRLGNDSTIGHIDTVTTSFDGLLEKINNCITKLDDLASKIKELPSVSVDGYAKGTRNAEKGLHEVAEEGAEIITDGKNAVLATTPTLMNMKGGETVYNADETKKILDGDGLEPIEVPQTVAKNPYAIDSLLSGQKLDLKSLVNRDIVLQRATPLDTYSMLEKYKDWVIPDSLIMSRLNLPSQDFSKLGVVNNNQQQTVIQINGDLSFPNIKSGNDAELLLNDLSNMANKARQRSARR